MKILALLWTVCLVRLCHGGDNGKVDESLFNVEDGEDNGFKVLKLTAKEGVAVNKLTYGDEIVWEEKDLTCLSAVLYFDVYEHTLAILETKSLFSGNKYTVYKYYDDKEWKSCKEKDHNVGLKKLKKYRPTIPVTLDLTSPDETKVNVHQEDDNGINSKKYTPKNYSKITSVVDDQTSIWTASGKEKFVFAELSSKGESSLLLILLKKALNKYFEKNADGKWTPIKKEDFNNKLKDLKNGVTKQSLHPSSSHSSAPSQ